MQRFLLLLCAGAPLFAQVYLGALGGISTLSADAGSAPSAGAVSLYKPENGPAATVFGGFHLSDYVALQANYVWNDNDLLLTFVSSGNALEQARGSSQKSVSGDLLVYFRNRRSWVRPYLSAGLGVVRFTSREQEVRLNRGSLPIPPPLFRETQPLVRFAVGIDLSLGGGWALRYSFAESIQDNPISQQLSPPGARNLANFQNLFGFLKRF